MSTNATTAPPHASAAATSIPSRERLLQCQGQMLQLVGGDGRALPVELVGVFDGTALDHTYCCYAAEIALPPGAEVPQGVYGLAADHDQVWHLLFTPVRPGEDGRPRLEAIFHVKRS